MQISELMYLMYFSKPPLASIEHIAPQTDATSKT
jgi:hypothetical protein